LVDAELADELLELGRRRQHERNAIAGDAPTGLVVVTVHGTRDVAARIGLGPASVDRRTDVEDDHLGAAKAGLEPGRRDDGRRRVGERRAGQRAGDEESAAKPAQAADQRNEQAKHGNTWWPAPRSTARKAERMAVGRAQLAA